MRSAPRRIQTASAGTALALLLALVCSGCPQEGGAKKDPSTGAAPNFYRFVADGVASMTFPVRHAIDAQVNFTWEKFSRLVTVKWEQGAKSPVVFFHGNVPAVAGKKLCSAVCSYGQFHMAAGNCELPEFKCLRGYTCAYPTCQCNAKDCVDDF